MKIEILLGVRRPLPLTQPHSPPNTLPPLGSQEVFDDDLVLKSYKRRFSKKTPGHGLPQNEQDRLAGTHSGTLTLLRVTKAGDRFYKPGIYLVQYVATYKFNRLPHTPLKKGQVTTRGLVLYDSTQNFDTLETPVRFAITGGTQAYEKARGQVIEGAKAAEDRRLVIWL